MKEYDVVVIGGSAAGISAAITAKRHYPDKSVCVLRKEKEVSIPCGIPYIFGTVGKPENNLIPDGVLEKNSIALIVDEAKGCDTEAKQVSLSGNEAVKYDKLILATGSNPIVPPIPGMDKKNIFPVKKDTGYLREALEAVDKANDLVVLGCGFIGVEFADECKKNRKLNVSIVEMLTHCLQVAFGESVCRCCEEIENALKGKGINIITEHRLEEVLGNGSITGVRLSDGREIKADALIVGIGVGPNIDLAQQAGLEFDPKLGIKVDANQRTSNPDIFACGDCASKFSFFNGKPSLLWLASIATNEARIAGANLYANRRKNPGVIGVFTTAIDDLAVGMAGLSETGARELGFDAVSAEAEGPNRHPGGMPGMRNMWVRLIFNRDNGELLGGAACGGPSVGELINTISACIQNRMTADDIATFQIGTHPAVTASPIAYQLLNAAEMALQKMHQAC